MRCDEISAGCESCPQVRTRPVSDHRYDDQPLRSATGVPYEKRCIKYHETLHEAIAETVADIFGILILWYVLMV